MKAQMMRILRALHPMNWLFERMPPAGIGMPFVGYKSRAVPWGHQPDGPGGPDGPGRPGPDTEPLPTGPAGVTDDTLREFVERQRVPA
jgi:hypothetical protein